MSEQIFYACQEFNSRDDRLRSSFLKRQFREVLDRTMVVAGKAVAEAVDLVRESGTYVSDARMTAQRAGSTETNTFRPSAKSV